MRQYQKRYADSTRLCYANYRRWSVIALMVCSLGAQSPQYMNIGRLQAVFMGNFYESYEHAASQYNPAYGNANLLFWPAEYTRTNARDHQGLLGAFGLYLALPDFTDKGGVNHDFYHASVWGDAGPHDNRIRMDEADTYSLWTEPTVTVDGVEKINYAEYVVPVLPAELGVVPEVCLLREEVSIGSALTLLPQGFTTLGRQDTLGVVVDQGVVPGTGSDLGFPRLPDHDVDELDVVRHLLAVLRADLGHPELPSVRQVGEQLILEDVLDRDDGCWR